MSARRLVGTAVTLAALSVAFRYVSAPALYAPTESITVHEDSLRAGPDSGRVARFIDVLGRTDPLICDIIADQLGNSYYEGARSLGRFGDAQPSFDLVKDSLAGHVRDPRAIKLLTATLAADNPCVRRASAKLLGRSNARSDALTPLLGNASARVREAAAYALGQGERKDARVALERMVQDRTGSETAMALWALGSNGDSASLPVVTRATRNSDPRVRLAAVWALGEFDDERALPELERALGGDTDATVRAAAAGALGNIGNVKSVRALATAIGDAAANVRLEAVDAISNLHDLRTAPDALTRAARSSDPRLRSRAAHALAEIHDPATVDVLIELVASDDREIRRRVIEALGEIASPKSKPALMRALKDSDPEVRRAAVEALAEIKA